MDISVPGAVLSSFFFGPALVVLGGLLPLSFGPDDGCSLFLCTRLCRAKSFSADERVSDLKLGAFREDSRNLFWYLWWLTPVCFSSPALQFSCLRDLGRAAPHSPVDISGAIAPAIWFRPSFPFKGSRKSTKPSSKAQVLLKVFRDTDGQGRVLSAES